MNEEYGEYSTDGGEKEEDYMSDNETLSKDNDEYLSYDAPVPDRLEYEAIGEKLEIDPATLTIIQVIGKGHYSDVYMGILSLPNESIPVAVKRQQKETSAMNAAESAAILKRQRQALKDELSIFAHLQSSSAGGHENVLKLLGAITTIKTDFCLLTEYCEYGSMDRFLQTKWENRDFKDELVFDGNENKQVWKIQRDSNWGEDFRSRRENGLITTSDLLWFALQIARGMQYLTDMKVIHRDIAVRNVLLKLDFTLKVADFGLSRKLKEGDDGYYVGKEGTALPIRYIAPESLKSGRFSITSEFWSFGVVVWELFTFAQNQPYSVEFNRYENNTHFYEFLFEYLSSGHRLTIPRIGPQQIKILLSRLWHADPKKRPSLQVCRKVIRQELMQSCPNILLQEKAPHHESKYSLIVFDDEDANERSVKKSIDSFVLCNTSLLCENNARFHPNSTFVGGSLVLENSSDPELYKLANRINTAAEDEACLTQIKMLLDGTKKQQNKEMQMRSSTWEVCMRRDKVCLSHMKKLSNGTENQQNKEMQMRNSTWETLEQQNKGSQMRKITLEPCIRMGEACLNQMNKLSHGTKKRQNKGLQVHNTTLHKSIEKGKALINQMTKL
uniref:Protein kinase domain-containing protein n=1 Tax=Plectus sambesii TaxID=2011161 RepID=A0A914VH99_9BILA